MRLQCVVILAGLLLVVEPLSAQPDSAVYGADYTIVSGTLNGAINASSCGTSRAPSWCSGSDVGAWINAAAGYSKAKGGNCQIHVTSAGIMSTAPQIPLGCTLDVFAPLALNVTWPLTHHGVVIDLHGNPVTGNTGPAPAIDIGKASANLVKRSGRASSTGTAVTYAGDVAGSGQDFTGLVPGSAFCLGASCSTIGSVNSNTSITLASSMGTQRNANFTAYSGSAPATVNTDATGKTLTWASGPAFDLDKGDQIVVNGLAANVIAVSSSTVTVGNSVCTSCSSVPYVGIIFPNNISANATPQPVTIKNLVLKKGTSAGDAIRATGIAGLQLEFPHFIGAWGALYDSRGSITANIFGLSSTNQVSGIVMDGFNGAGFVSGSNANHFYGVSMTQSTTASGIAIYTPKGSKSGYNFFGNVELEGNANDAVIADWGQGKDRYEMSDYEQNGTATGGYEILLESNYNKISGPAQMQTYHPYLIYLATGTVGNVIEDLQITASKAGAVGIHTGFAASARIINNTFLAGTMTLPKSPTGKVVVIDTDGNYTGNAFNAIGGISVGGNAVPTKAGTPAANRGVCWKTPGTLGYCSTGLDPNGACICN